MSEPIAALVRPRGMRRPLLRITAVVAIVTVMSLMGGCSAPVRPAPTPLPQASTLSSFGPAPSSPSPVEPRATPTPTPATPAPGALLTVEWRGGLCPQGLCDRSIEIDADGTVRSSHPTAHVVGQLAPAMVDRLAVEIGRADYDAIKSRPFRGTCPVAYDGQEVVYTFHPAAGAQVIASCVVAIDRNDPLFRAADAAIAAIPAGG